MKNKFKREYIEIGITAFCVLLSLMLVFFAIYRWNYILLFFKSIFSILMPFIFGLVIAYLLNPSVKFFEKKVYLNLYNKILNKNVKKSRVARILSLATSSLIFLGCLIICMSYLIPEMVKSFETLVLNLNLYLNNSEDYLVILFNESESIKLFIQDNYGAFAKFISKELSDGSMLNGMMKSLSTGIFGTLKFIYNIVIGYIIAIYILLDKEKFKAQIKKFLYTFFDDDKIDDFIDNAKYTDKIFIGFFSGKIIDSLIIGILCFVGCLLLGVPYALIIAVIVGITNIIPYFGPIIGAVPSCLLILLVDPSKCVSFIIFVFILQLFDGNVLGPKILGEKTGLSSFWVLFSLLIFGGLFGVVGMIIGVPIFSIIYTFVNNQLKKKLKEKSLPVDSKDYEETMEIKDLVKKIQEADLVIKEETK